PVSRACAARCVGLLQCAHTQRRAVRPERVAIWIQRHSLKMASFASSRTGWCTTRSDGVPEVRSDRGTCGPLLRFEGMRTGVAGRRRGHPAGPDRHGAGCEKGMTPMDELREFRLDTDRAGTVD